MYFFKSRMGSTRSPSPVTKSKLFLLSGPCGPWGRRLIAAPVLRRNIVAGNSVYLFMVVMVKDGMDVEIDA
jgi:hypothetical protein